VALDHPAVAVCASGAGTTFQAILEAVGDGVLPCRVNTLVVDRPGTGAEQRARDAGITVHRVRRGPGLSAEMDAALPTETALVVLAGFLSIVGEPVLSRFHRRMINLHPALLPAHGGPGMYGLAVHRAVIAAGDSQSGCTVHYVDAGTDTGEIILHRRVPVLPGDTPELLQARIRPVERAALVAAILTLIPDLR
jgi:phosphoribosylglycinamide formyltransferase-1